MVEITAKRLQYIAAAPEEAYILRLEPQSSSNRIMRSSYMLRLRGKSSVLALQLEINAETTAALA
jgi:hypothetical protein